MTKTFEPGLKSLLSPPDESFALVASAMKLDPTDSKKKRVQQSPSASSNPLSPATESGLVLLQIGKSGPQTNSNDVTRLSEACGRSVWEGWSREAPPIPIVGTNENWPT
jgi:hypothetical protein